MKKYLCPQYQTHGCGIACVKTVLSLLFKDASYRFLEEPDCEKEAPNLEELIAYAKTYGLELDAYRIPRAELISADRTPLFLIYEHERGTHMKLLLRIKKKHYWIYDPLDGLQKIEKEDALEGFTGVFLQVDHAEEVRKPAVKRGKPFAFRIVPFLFSLLAMGFFLSGSLTLGSTLPYVVPLILLSIGVLFMLLFCFSSYQGMKKFDQEYGEKIYDADRKKRQERFRLFHAYKQKVFGRGTGALFSLILSLSIACALAFRDFALGITFLIALGFLIISWVSDVPKAEEKKNEIVRLETKILSKEKNDNGMQDTIGTCLKEAREYSRYYLLRNVSIFLLSVLLSLTSLALQNRLTFDAFIYYLFPIFFFAEQVDTSYANYRNRKEESRLENRFVSEFVLVKANTRTHIGENGLQ